MGEKIFWRKAAAVFLAVTVAVVGTPWQVSVAGEEVEPLWQNTDAVKETALLRQIEEQYEDVDLSEAANEKFGTAALIVGCYGSDVKLREPGGCNHKADTIIALGDGVFALFYASPTYARDAWIAFQKTEGILFAEPDVVVEGEEWTGKWQDGQVCEETEASKFSVNMEQPGDMQMAEPLSEDRPDIEVAELEGDGKAAVLAAVIDTGVDLKNAAIREYLVNPEGCAEGGNVWRCHG